MIKGNAPEKKPVALIAGPTASGKSDLAVDLALALERAGRRAAVINADSAQVYADLQVLSARPTKEDMRCIEHRLFGAWDGATACSAADWASAAKREIAELHANDSVPILVGGTGLYIRTLLDGIAPVPKIDEGVRRSVRALPVAEACRALQSADPERAATLDPTDSTRIARALEVVRSTGKPLSYWQQRKEGGIGDDVQVYPLILLPEREWLYQRCDKRFAAMLEHGAVEEVEGLLARQLEPSLPVMRAIGVPEIIAFLRNDTSRDTMMACGQQATRNYAKRQYTWFRRQPPPDWPRMAPENIDIDNIFGSLFQD